MLALTSFGHDKIITKTVSVDQLYQQTKFLSGLLVKEFVLRYNLQHKKRFDEVVKLMENKKFIKVEDGCVMLGS